jgi:hypothetical protein
MAWKTPIDDALNEIAREGARRMLAQAMIAEADTFVAELKDLKLSDGRDRIVRHGYGPERTIQTGTWRRLKGQNQLSKLVEGVRFQNGVSSASESIL